MHLNQIIKIKCQIVFISNSKNIDAPPGHDHYLQHEKMIDYGLCQVAEKNKYKNRYCNLFPFDQNLVHLDARK